MNPFEIKIAAILYFHRYAKEFALSTATLPPDVYDELKDAFTCGFVDCIAWLEERAKAEERKPEAVAHD